jgi:rhodanese-related sulfurtransferase
MKIDFKEIALILIAAIVIAFAYNFSKPKPMPLFWEPKDIKTVSDDDLFGNMEPKQIQTDDNDLADDIITEPSNDKANQDAQIVDDKNDLVVSRNGIAEKENETLNREILKNSEFTVTYEQMKKIISNPDFIVIDARNPEMYAKSKIGKAINIFPYDEEAVFMPKILDLPTDKRIVIYCDGGNCDSSHKLAEAIKTFGYKNVFIYSGGWDDWSKHQGLK